MFDLLLQDLRLAVRSLRRRPLLLLIPVLSLSVGIGATTAVFSVVNRFLLKPPDQVPNAGRIVELGRGRDGRGFDSFSYPDLLDLRAEADPLQELAAFEMQMLTISRGEAGERVFGMLVSANYFDVLGVRPALGRAFLPEEDQGPNEHPVVVLAHGLWKARMGGDPGIVGSTVLVNRQPYRVVGIAPEGFRGHMAVGSVDLYVPIMQYPALNEGADWFQRRSSSWFQVLGLLRPGATEEEAGAAVSTVFRRLADDYPDTNAHRTGAVRSYGALPAAIRGPTGLFLALLMAFSGLILLITCANVSGIFLARASSRTKETAIRLSMGSSRSRLLRHFLSESLLIFLLGGVGGLLLAVWGLGVLAAVEIPAPVPLALEYSPDARVVFFTLVLTLGSGLLFGLLPGRQALKLDLLGALKEEGGRRGSSEGRLRRGFVAAQVGASLVLLVAAGLLVRALQRAGEIERGFTAEGAFLTFLDLSAEGVGGEERDFLQEEILERFRAQPWVEDVTLALDLPLDLSSHETGMLPEGWEPSEDRSSLGVEFNAVSPGYFSTLKIPVLEGRPLDGRDRDGAEPVGVVSRTFAEEVWPGESALGRRVLWGTSGDDWITVVGVVENIHNQLLTDAPEPYAYRPLAQYRRSETHLVVRTPLEDAQVVQEIHRSLRAIDANLSLSPVIRLDHYTAVGILPQRIAGIVAMTLGLLALFLSGMGIYGVMAFSVYRRTRELGIRAALGAEPARVLWGILVGGFRLALPGLILGAGLSFLVARLLRGLLLGVSPMDPWAMGAVILVTSGMVLGGTLVPARRAARVDPAEALRYD